MLLRASLGARIELVESLVSQRPVCGALLAGGWRAGAKEGGQERREPTTYLVPDVSYLLEVERCR